MPNQPTQRRVTLSVEALEVRELLSVTTAPHASFAVALAAGTNYTPGLVSTASNTETARAWLSKTQPANVQASASVSLTSPTPAQVLVRGSNLGTSAPSYYAASVTRGLHLQLIRTVRGVSTTLGQIKSASPLSSGWVQVTLRADGTTLQAQAQRLDNNRYLNARGQWQTAPTFALTVTDRSLTAGGQVGLDRASGTAGAVAFDDVRIGAATNSRVYTTENFNSTRPGNLPTGWVQWSNQSTRVPSSTPPSTRPSTQTVHFVHPTNGSTLSKPTSVQVTVSNPNLVDHVDFLVDGARLASDASSPYSWTIDPSLYSNGSHTLEAIVYQQNGSSVTAHVTVTTHTASEQGLIPQHYPWIRIAQLAYSGFTLGPVEQQLLQNSVDLVVPNSAYLPDIQAVAPRTPQLIYTNDSTLYQDLLVDWLNYADAHGASREGAFYHVSQTTRFFARSSSAIPVNWFWGVYQGGQTADFNDVTSLARNSKAITFGGDGTSLYLAYPDKFREINLKLATPARAGWSYTLEYANKVDANGIPLNWAPLSTLTDSTRGLTRSGQITFDPPADWKTASIDGSARMFAVRIRTVADGGAPIATGIFGRDYTNGHGGYGGTIPVFDYSADTNHDGYLDNKEYAHRKRGDDARFAYESRLFPVGTGPMRPATNPSDPTFRAWAADYARRFLASQPLADGLFVDNSGGKGPATGGVVESLTSYANDYGALLNQVGKAIAPHFLIANTSGGGTSADGVIRQNTGYFEEFAIRPLAHNWQQFEDTAALIAHRQSLKSPAPFAILDALPAGGSPTDGRTQLATLAYYYMVADPHTTFLDFYGGYEPSTSWARHWSPAAAYNVGQPLGNWSLLAKGSDPANRTLTYHVYERKYSNALILYKPLSYAQGRRNGPLGGASGTTIQLDGTYRPLNANGTLGAPTKTVKLANGSGAILIKA